MKNRSDFVETKIFMKLIFYERNNLKYVIVEIA